jgi:hypothetical protein
LQRSVFLLPSKKLQNVVYISKHTVVLFGIHLYFIKQDIFLFRIHDESMLCDANLVC